MKKSAVWLLCLLAAALAGLLLLQSGQTESEADLHSPEEKRLAAALSRVTGAAGCEVFLFEEAQASTFGGREQGAVVFISGEKDLALYLRVQSSVHTATGIPIESIDIYFSGKEKEASE